MFRIFKKIAHKKEAANPTANIKSVELPSKREYTFCEKVKFYLKNKKQRGKAFAMIRDREQRDMLMEEVEEILSNLFNILIEEKKINKAFKKVLNYICKLDNIIIFKELIEKYLEILKNEDLFFEEIKKIFMQNKII